MLVGMAIRRRAGGPRGAVLFAAASVLIALGVVPAAGGEDSVELGDVIEGWRVFHAKRCVHCHAIWGQGGQIGPDLGRTYRGHLSASELAAGMWNHVPRMLTLMRQHRLPEVTLSRAEMADLFSFLYFVRYLDEPGNPAEGRRILREKRCTECHSLEHGDGAVGPDLTRWAGFVNPIVWAQMMWEHGAGMAAAMKKANIKWPKLGDEDLSNIIAFVRSVAASRDKTYLRPGSPSTGRRLFSERKCSACHAADSAGELKGPDLTTIALPPSLSALASRMWNHLPAMRRVMAEQQVEVAPLSAQDMADIIAFLFAMQYEGRPGDPARGRQVFQQKRCVHCHTISPLPAGTPAPARQSSAVGMGQVIWQHGARMSEQMALAGIPWPTFQRTQMADLIAYVESAGKIAVKPQFAGTAKPDSAKQDKPR